MSMEDVFANFDAYLAKEKSRIDGLFLDPHEADLRLNEDIHLVQEAMNTVSVFTEVFTWSDRGDDFYSVYVNSGTEQSFPLTIRRHVSGRSNKIVLDRTIVYNPDISPQRNAALFRPKLETLGLPTIEGVNIGAGKDNPYPVFIIWPTRNFDEHIPDTILSFTWTGLTEERFTTNASWRIRKVTQADILALQTALLRMGETSIEDNT